jgi:hypothetical protein
MDDESRAIKATLPVVLWLALGTAEREQWEDDRAVLHSVSLCVSAPKPKKDLLHGGDRVNQELKKQIRGRSGCVWKVWEDRRVRAR